MSFKSCYILNKGCILASLGNLLLPGVNEETSFSITNNCVKSHCLAIAYKYGESDDRTENSDFLLLRQKDPFGELFSEYTFKLKFQRGRGS